MEAEKDKEKEKTTTGDTFLGKKLAVKKRKKTFMIPKNKQKREETFPRKQLLVKKRKTNQKKLQTAAATAIRKAHRIQNPAKTKTTRTQRTTRKRCAQRKRRRPSQSSWQGSEKVEDEMVTTQECAEGGEIEIMTLRKDNRELRAEVERLTGEMKQLLTRSEGVSSSSSV